MKRFDDTGAHQLKILEDKTVECYSYPLTYTLHKNSKYLSRQRKQSFKTSRLYHWRADLYERFVEVSRRIYPHHHEVMVLEALLDAYVNHLAGKANVKIELFQPLIEPMETEPHRISEKAALTILQKQLTILLNCLNSHPDDIESKEELCQLLAKERNASLVSSSHDKDILNLWRKAEAYL